MIMYVLNIKPFLVILKNKYEPKDEQSMAFKPPELCSRFRDNFSLPPPPYLTLFRT